LNSASGAEQTQDGEDSEDFKRYVKYRAVAFEAAQIIRSAHDGIKSNKVDGRTE
jgi:hypothetical protein